MFTLLADAMFAATLARRGNNIPDHLKTHSSRYIPEHERKRVQRTSHFNPYRDLW